MIRVSLTSSVLILLVAFSFAATSLFGQKGKFPFTGTLTYRVTICDTALAKYVPIRYMIVRTNDTLTRIENETDRLGKQIVIKHLGLNKSYLLLNTPIGKYAIQTNHNEAKKDSILPYSFKKKCGRRTFCGIKAKKSLVSHKGFTEPLTFYYFKDYAPKYLNVFENCPGLPVLYYIPTDDGIFKYELISLDSKLPVHDLFGVPSDFKRVTFDQFLEEMMQGQGELEDPEEKK
jgi:hypothetical protein